MLEGLKIDRRPPTYSLGLPETENILEGIQAEIFTILNVNLPLDPGYYLLSLSPRGDMGGRVVQLIHILLLEVRKMKPCLG